MRRYAAWGMWLAGTLWLLDCAASNTPEDDGTNCPVGAERCPCTQGGSCDQGLECLSGLCVDPTPGNGGGGGASSAGGGFSNGSGGQTNCDMGCKKLDILFSIDHSGSMQPEVNALAATQAFTEVINTIAALNCGDIEFRVGLTDDNDRGFIVPNGWNGPSPWFDSTVMSVAEVATAFNQAAGSLLAGQETPLGCEHVLTSATNLLKNDGTGFVRNDALLVLVLVTDVDDYGAYDQGLIDCGLFGMQQGCTTPPPPLNTLHGDLLNLKSGDATGLAAIVVAGDPSITAGYNVCMAPATCCGSLDCDEAFHADRLWAFTDLLTGSNGFAANICTGAQSVPTAVKDAFEGNIDLACQGFRPPK